MLISELSLSDSEQSLSDFPLSLQHSGQWVQDSMHSLWKICLQLKSVTDSLKDGSILV